MGRIVVVIFGSLAVGIVIAALVQNIAASQTSERATDRVHLALAFLALACAIVAGVAYGHAVQHWY